MGFTTAMEDFRSKLGHLGRPMNNGIDLDEFMRNVVSSDENNNSTNIHNHNNNNNNNNGNNNQRQISAAVHSASSPSSSSSSSSPVARPFNLMQTLSKKTVEEVWRDVIGQDQENNVVIGARQPNNVCGDTTLEDFLIRNGSINSVSDQQIAVIDPIVAAAAGSQQQMDWLQFQLESIHHHHHHQRQQQQQQQQQQQLREQDGQRQQQMEVLGNHLPISGPFFGDPVGEIGYSENQMALSMPMPEAASSGSQAVAERKRRLSDEMMEKNIERKQKRMIKNRESAARSRARKQAYTNKLENDVSRLKESNALLEKQMVLMRLPFDPTSRPKYQLRRTSSARF